MVLVVTALVLSILMVLAYALSFAAGVNRRMARNVREATLRRQAAQSVLSYALAILLEDARASDFDALSEDWAAPGRTVEVDGQSWSIHLADADGRLNVNRAVRQPQDEEEQVDLRPALRRLIEEAGGAERDFEAIVGWLDPADPILLIATLREVPGLDETLFRQEPGQPALDRLLTTHSGHVNVNTAPEQVLLALCGDRAVAEGILERRNGDPFQTRAELETFLQRRGASETVGAVVPFLDVVSEFFIARVSPVGAAPEGALTAFVRRAKESIQILHVWHGVREEEL